YSISEVTQLASAATRVNAGKISLTNPTQALETQELGEQFAWKQGVIESKTVKVKADTDEITLSETLVTGESPSIKVNGKTLVVQTDSDAELKANEVRIGTDGVLEFGTALKKDDLVKIDYVIKNKTVDFTYSSEEEPPKQWSIGATNINVTSIIIGVEDVTDQLVKVDGSETKYKIDNVGVIDFSTGIITFDDLEEGKTP